MPTISYSTSMIVRCRRWPIGSFDGNCDRARLIDQTLTRARADSGQIALASAPVDIGALASSLVEQIQPKFETRGIAPSCEQQEDVVVGSRRVIRHAGAGSTFTVTLPTARAVHPAPVPDAHRATA